MSVAMVIILFTLSIATVAKMAFIILLLTLHIFIKFTYAENPRIIHEIDLVTLEKYGGWVPTGLTAFGAVMAIAIKKIILLAIIIFGVALVLKFFTGFGSHHCQHKPIYYKEIEYDKPYYEHKFDEYGRKFRRIR